MECLNRVILRGTVGSAVIQSVSDTSVVRFSLTTDYAYKNRDGLPAIETSWHQITAWNSVRMPDFLLIKKGAFVTVEGRIRTFKYTDRDGTEKNGVYILASKIAIEEPANRKTNGRV